MHKIIVIGDKDSIYGFSCSGIETCFVSEAEEALSKIRHFAQQEYALIFVVESLHSKIRDQLREYDEMLLPAIISIPGVSGNTGDGLCEVESFVERSVGSDILFGSKSKRN